MSKTQSTSRLVKLLRSNLLLKLVQFNMKIIFAGKFIWFIAIALLIFCLLMFNSVWNMQEINESTVYSQLLFPALLLVFYPSVFGIQNDADARILEILFGIPDYRYKVWGFRLLMIYVVVFFLLIAFCGVAILLLYPVNPVGMAAQMMFTVLFFGNMAFMFSTITRSGSGTAVIMIVLLIIYFFLDVFGLVSMKFWDVLFNPYRQPNNVIPIVWQNALLKNRAFLIIASIVWGLLGLLNLQKREKFV